MYSEKSSTKTLGFFKLSFFVSFFFKTSLLESGSGSLLLFPFISSDWIYTADTRFWMLFSGVREEPIKIPSTFLFLPSISPSSRGKGLNWRFFFTTKSTSTTIFSLFFLSLFGLWTTIKPFYFLFTYFFAPFSFEITKSFFPL